MKKLIPLVSLMLSLSSTALAQYSTDWIRPADSYQKTGVQMVRDQQDNVIATGYWISYNLFTRKYNKFGVLQWEAVSASGIPSNYERPCWVTVDNNDNIFVAGYRYAGTGTPVAIIVLKYNPQGVELWKKVISPVNYLVGMSLRCEADNNGNLYVGATGVGALPGFALIKLDPDGNILFTQNSDVNAPKIFSSMRLKGNRIVLTSSSGSPSIAPVSVWDTAGNLLWTAGLQGRGGSDVEIDESGNIYLLTSFSNQVSPTSQMDISIYKFNPTGTQLWKKDFDFGGYEFSTRFAYAAGKLTVIGDGSLASAYFDWITFQTDADGNMIWNTRYNETSGNDEQPYFLAAKLNGDVFVTGKGGPNYTVAGTPYLRMITLKYDSTGVRKWVDSVNVYSGWGLACTLASDSSLYVLSGTSMTVFHFLDHNGNTPPAQPGNLTVSNITNSSATFSWTPVSGATLYHLRYRVTGSTTWSVASINIPTITINGLAANTFYDYACESVGSGGPSGYVATQVFLTSGTTLAISGIQFSASRQGTNVMLHWSTATEYNSAYFEVERSVDGILFSKIGQLPAAGNSNALRQYGFIDNNTPEKMLFYRLRLVDAFAGYSFSPVRIVPKQDGKDRSFILFPNPATSDVTLVLNNAAREDLPLQLISPIGQTVKTITLLKGTQYVKIDLAGLPKGSYLVKITGAGFVRETQFLIKY